MPSYFADECIAAELVALLRTSGLDVAYAKELCPGAPDETVLALAAASGRVVLTDDLGFGELVVRHHRPATGIVILSLYSLPARLRSAHAAHRIRDLGDGAIGHPAVIEPRRTRTRPLAAGA